MGRLTRDMRAALARLQVAVSIDDPERIAEAGEFAAQTVDFSRFKLAGGYMGTRLYVSNEIPRGWVLTSGKRQGAIHPDNLPHIFVGDREDELMRDVCTGPAGARMLSDHVMARLIEVDLELLTQFPS